MRNAINRIAYVDLHGRLCTIAPDGGRPRTLSAAGLRCQFPAWSPDGQFLAAIGSRPGGAGVYRFRDRSGFFRDADPQELYFGQVQAPLYLYWAPDSSRLGFLVGYPQSIALYLSPPPGQQESQLIETGQPFFWSWMPDSAYLLIHTGGMGRAARLSFIDQDGEDWGQALAEPGYFQAPAISADGRYWAFAALDAHGRSRLVVEHHTSGERLVVPHVGAVALSWQPGAERLTFISPQESAQHFFGALQFLELPSGRVDTLIGEQVLAFFWSPNGRYLAYFTLSPSRGPGGALLLDLWILDAAENRRRRLFAFQPPGYFVDQFLPIFDQYAHSHRLWSPDSRALVLPVLENGALQIAVAGLDGRLTYLAQGVMPSWSQN